MLENRERKSLRFEVEASDGAGVCDGVYSAHYCRKTILQIRTCMIATTANEQEVYYRL